MPEIPASTARCPRDKLGLALAGGGFRASLFHVGVLKRLARLDLLRYVEVISTVSGGSVTGICYALLLKARLEEKQIDKQRVVLSQEDYCQITTDLQRLLKKAIQRNLRTLLFTHPLHLLRFLFTPFTLGERMAELYDQHLIEVIRREFLPQRLAHPGPVTLPDIKVSPGGASIGQDVLGKHSDIESYNRSQVTAGGSAISKLIINATSLNTGVRFWFSGSELGEWQYGSFRLDEAQDLVALKQRIGSAKPATAQAKYPLESWWHNTGYRIEEQGLGAFAQWPLDKQHRWPSIYDPLIESWHRHFNTRQSEDVGLYALCTAQMGQLRLLRETVRKCRQLSGTSSDEEMLIREYNLVNNLGSICHVYLEQIDSWYTGLGVLKAKLHELIEALYCIRSAHRAASTLHEDLASFPLSHALAASANFPPVFPPFPIRNIYDDHVVKRLGLTDGGVFDNLGITSLLNEQCNYIISSDTGGAFKFRRKSSQGRLGMIFRIASLLQEVSVGRLRERLLEQHAVSSGLGLLDEMPPTNPDSSETHSRLARLHAVREMHGLTIFRIDAPAVLHREAVDPETHPYSADDVAGIRTDLDVFTDIETNLLIRQGFANAGLYLKKWFGFGNDETPGMLPEHIRRRYRSESCDYPFARAADADWKDPLPDTPLDENDRRLKESVAVADILLLRYPLLLLTSHIDDGLKKKFKLGVYSVVLFLFSLAGLWAASQLWQHTTPSDWPWWSILAGVGTSVLFWTVFGVILPTCCGDWPAQKAWFILIAGVTGGSIVLGLLAIWPLGMTDAARILSLVAVLVAGLPGLGLLLLLGFAWLEYLSGILMRRRHAMTQASALDNE